VAKFACFLVFLWHLTPDSLDGRLTFVLKAKADSTTSFSMEPVIRESPQVKAGSYARIQHTQTGLCLRWVSVSFVNRCRSLVALQAREDLQAQGRAIHIH
jgi:hypothetical protein